MLEEEKLKSESREIGQESRESKEEREEKEAGAKERMEQAAVEVKNTKQRIQNIMVNMQQVLKTVRTIRQQLGLDDQGEVPALARDEKALAELRKKLQGLEGQMEDLKNALYQEEVSRLRQMNPDMTDEQLSREATARVESMVGVL